MKKLLKALSKPEFLKALKDDPRVNLLVARFEDFIDFMPTLSQEDIEKITEETIEKLNNGKNNDNESILTANILFI